MTEKIASEIRSRMMASIRGKNTQPELKIRTLLHILGFRFRLHRKDLAGRPDIILPRHRLAIFVHGCFWHRHTGCKFATSPKSNTSFWQEKFERNVRRDNIALERLDEAGWRTLIVWECVLKGEDATSSLPRQLRKAVLSRLSRCEIPRAKTTHLDSADRQEKLHQ